MTDDNEARWRRESRRPWIPGVVADRYEVERELGAGAAAVTVAARDRRLGRLVAIKILRPEDEHDPAFSQRFTREARAAASINHPNVVDVYDVGQEGDLLYLVMQYVAGTDLKRMIEREGALQWRRAVEIASAVLAGLTPIHAAGIVHRDIKPQNVLIGADGEVKVTDFGVAHVERDSSLTAVGTTVGTAAYMAPEQAQGEPPSPAADVYAVGVMLYEMVTGRLPFDEPTSVATMLAHIQRVPNPPIAPRGREPIPEGIVLVIRQALAKDPRARFRSAEAMRRALEHPELVAAAAPDPRATGAPTRVVPVQAARRAPAVAPQGRPSTNPPRMVPPARESRRFGATFAMLLLLLAVAFAAVAGAMWVLGERPDLFGGGDGGDGEPTSIDQPTDTPGPTATSPTQPTEPPVVIEPIDDEPTPTPIPPTPTPTPVPPTPTPTPTESPPTVVVVEPEPTEPSTGEEIPQIIEPIDESTEPAT